MDEMNRAESEAELELRKMIIRGCKQMLIEDIPKDKAIRILDAMLEEDKEKAEAPA